MSSCDTLLIGYGNAWRADDGAGPAVIARLRQLLGPAADEHSGASSGLRLLAERQLLPELACELAQARRALFFDAGCDLPPGAVERQLVQPAAAPLLGHQLTPGGLLGLTRAAFGRAPTAWLWTIGVASLDHGEGLSPEVEARVERLAAEIVQWLSTPSHVQAAPSPAAASPDRCPSLSTLATSGQDCL